MANPFDRLATTLGSPARDYLPVTPSDSVDFANVAQALFIEGAGFVRFVSEAGGVRTVSVPDFGWILCGVRRVNATGTTATGIHALSIGG